MEFTSFSDDKIEKFGPFTLISSVLSYSSRNWLDNNYRKTKDVSLAVCTLVDFEQCIFNF